MRTTVWDWSVLYQLSPTHYEHELSDHEVCSYLLQIERKATNTMREGDGVTLTKQRKADIQLLVMNSYLALEQKHLTCTCRNILRLTGKISLYNLALLSV